MYTFEAMQRAADSLGMNHQREGASLEVTLAGGLVLRLADDEGHTTQRISHAKPLLGWWTAANNIVLTVTLMVVFVFQPLSRWTVVVACLVGTSLLSWCLTSIRSERLRERLFDRAYDMSKPSA
jgi:hypothetical protein